MKKKNNYKVIEFYKNYTSKLNNALASIDHKALPKICDLIIKTIKKKNSIFVCGNGGSAAIANHYVCDYLKLIRTFTNFKPNVYSLSTNIELITAIANDISYDEIFKYQAESYCKKGDLLIIISSSGNSKNVTKLIQFAKKRGLKTIGFCGFKGGFVKKNSSISLHVNINNYGLSEDAHHILMHSIMQYIVKKYSS